MKRLPLKVSSSAVLLILLIVLSVLWFGLNDNGFLSLHRERNEVEIYVERIRALEEENGRILEEINRFKKDMVYVESVARRELNMIKENEIIFRVPKKSGRQTVPADDRRSDLRD